MELLRDTQVLLPGISAAWSLAPAEREMNGLLHLCKQIQSFHPHLGGNTGILKDLIYYLPFWVWGSPPAGLGLIIL